MKSWVWILLGIAALYALGYAVAQAAGMTVCDGNNTVDGVRWVCTTLAEGRPKWMVLVGLAGLVPLMLLAMPVLKVTHGMPFRAWIDTPLFLEWVERIGLVAKTAPRVPTPDERAMSYTDEAHVEALAALPDRVLWAVLLWIRPLNPDLDGRDMSMGVPAEELNVFRQGVQDLVDMGLLHWEERQWGFTLNFHPYLVGRLAAREDLLGPLRARVAGFRTV